MKRSSLFALVFFGMVSGVGAVFYPMGQHFWWVGFLFTFLFALPSFIALVTDGEVRSRLWWILGLTIFSWGLEAFAVQTGWPYGSFSYDTSVAGPKLFGLVPLQVPFAWLPLVFSASYIVSCKPWRWEYKAAVSSVILVIMDLVLDPGAVGMGIWKYETEGWYFGVPWSNFLGWFVSGFVVAAVLHKKIKLRSPYLNSSAIVILAFWTTLCVSFSFWFPAALGICLVLTLCYSSSLKNGML